jgi:hypothetical protein
MNRGFALTGSSVLFALTTLMALAEQPTDALAALTGTAEQQANATTRPKRGLI